MLACVVKSCWKVKAGRLSPHTYAPKPTPLASLAQYSVGLLRLEPVLSCVLHTCMCSAQGQLVQALPLLRKADSL